ncbi:helix-turn-helix transcriptional regulator [Chryseolinea lacunae]|uniref:Helix-turn-helix domain-containing protein n=1 Tax=Chryseolinea lacunae TaxID=2801331 RepID=A0ABS1KMB5_9BACT|nr:helix-turn-helix transcriptional regulator [Chryseolinea lacunae]MBL0740581.1 helix-turn-helix domain-containing protein [Chryseolinea lacunae]
METIPVRRLPSAQNELNPSDSFNIRDVRNILGGKDMIQELHRHDFFHIFVLKKGTGRHEIDFTSHKIADNSIFMMRPGQVHSIVLDAKSSGYLMEFTTDFYRSHDKSAGDVLRQATQPDLCKPGAEQFKKIEAIMSTIFQEYTSKHERYKDVIKAHMGVFFIELIRSRQNRKSASKPVAPYAQERLDEFLELLETHIATHKQVSHYADLLNLSPFQLNAITKAMLGKTGSEVITEHIVLEAKRNLLATSAQVNQIAYQLGYEDVSYFIRFFKKHTRHTPDAFRRAFL